MKKLPHIRVLLRLVDEGWTLTRIASEYGVGHQAVAAALRRDKMIFAKPVGDVAAAVSAELAGRPRGCQICARRSASPWADEAIGVGVVRCPVAQLVTRYR